MIMEIKEAIEIMKSDKILDSKKVLKASDIIITALQNGYTLCKLDEAIQKMEDEKDYSYADFTQYAEEYGIDEEYDDFYHRGLERAIQILKEACR